MPRRQCSHCSANVPGEARFCPRCGNEADGATGGRSASSGAGKRVPGALPSRSPMPLAGILFLAAAVLGPTMIAVGISTGSLLLLFSGITIAIVLIVLLLLGMVC
jgi:hypothetical protein